jgi:hypothetical protein
LYIYKTSVTKEGYGWRESLIEEEILDSAPHLSTWSKALEFNDEKNFEEIHRETYKEGTIKDLLAK